MEDIDETMSHAVSEDAAAATDLRTTPTANAAITTTSNAATPASPATTAYDAAAAAAAAAAANKTRRSHRKSRNGCAECKRRHIRCDERRPVCSNCMSADRACVFPRAPGSSSSVTAAAAAAASPVSEGLAKNHGPNYQSHRATTSPHPQQHRLPSPSASSSSINGNGHTNGGGGSTPSPSSHISSVFNPRQDFPFGEVTGPLPRPSSSANFRRSNYTYYPNANSSIDTAPPTPQATHATGAASSPGHSLDSDGPASASIFTPFHLQVMHHIQTVMIQDQAINTNNHFQQIIDIAMRHAVDAPYLINEILALGVVHMAIQKENQIYQQQSQLQSQQQQQYDVSASAATTSHASTILPPLLPPHGSPSSTSSPASSSILPSMSPAASSCPMSAMAATAGPPSATATAAAAAVSNNSIIANLRHQATELQTRAVTNFTRLTAHLPPDDTATCIPRFLFSSTLSMHALADSLAELRAANADFHGFIDRFVDCFNLYRGILAVIQPTFQFLSDSELRPLLSVTREANLGIVEHGNECQPLLDLLRRSDLAASSLDACRLAVEKLQWAFNLHNNLPPDAGQHAVSAFSVIVSAEYVDVLRKHRPEALIILSYFAVLLHRSRNFWIFQNSGAIMIRAIATHIGSYWRDAMAWPLQVVETEGC